MRSLPATLALTVVTLGPVAACSNPKTSADGAPASAAPAATSAAPSPGPADTTASAAASPPATADPSLVGTQYGYITSVDVAARTLTFDRVDWFSGTAATKACKADGVPITDDEKCHDYYIRDHNKLLRTAAISPSAKFYLQSPDDPLVQLEITLSNLSTKRQDRLFVLTFADGTVTRVKEQFLP